MLPNVQYIHVKIQTQVKTLQRKIKLFCTNGSRCSSTSLRASASSTGLLCRVSAQYDILTLPDVSPLEFQAKSE